MRRFVFTVAVFAVAVAGWAQVIPDPVVRAERSDGTEPAFALPPETTGGVIVEYVAPPVTRSAGKTAINYRATFTRFRNDLVTIVNAGRAGKSALAPPEIHREYFVVLNG